MTNCIIYALVSFGEKPLVQYSEFKGLFLKIFQSNLNNIEANTSKAFKIDDNNFIYYINESNITYLIIADSEFLKASALSFLQSIKKEFLSAYADTDLTLVEELGLDKEFKDTLKKKFEYYNEKKDVIDETLENYKDQLSKLNERILNTCDFLSERDLYKILNDRSVQLVSSGHYYKNSKRVKKKRIRRIIYITIGITVAILVILYVVISIICGSWTFQCGS
jgi:Tat protein secretion system quality control protein TatD with DNase activity